MTGTFARGLEGGDGGEDVSIMSNMARMSVRYVCCTKGKVSSGCFWIFTPSENFMSLKSVVPFNILSHSHVVHVGHDIAIIIVMIEMYVRIMCRCITWNVVV